MADIVLRVSWIGSNYKTDSKNEYAIQNGHFHHQFVDITKLSNSVTVKVSGFFLDSVSNIS